MLNELNLLSMIIKKKLMICKNKYCSSPQNKTKSGFIDNLYCSLACKMQDSKKGMATLNKSNEEKPVIDRQKLLATLKNRINRRKQMLPSFNKNKSTLNDNSDGLKATKPVNSKEPEKSKESKKPEKPQEPEKPKESQIRREPIELIEPIYPPRPLYKVVPQPATDMGLGDFKIVAKPLVITREELEMNARTSAYINKSVLIPAPKKFFDSPFPSRRNLFTKGHKLEAIDPEHEALFCVMTVVETCGYRLKLHFDGYSSNYDYWVNADCPDIFYTNWCLENNRTLQPPKGYKKKFEWIQYFKENTGSIRAPKINFVSTKNLSSCSKHKFFVGNKLEALDKMTRTLSKQLICVATVADVLNNRIRIHFDGWTDDFDYWIDISSNNIHPIGWCDKNGRNLCPPNGYDDLKGKKPFSWTEYLKETNSKPVPEESFIRRPLKEFTVNMAIEVVDLVVPSLIRIAKVVDIKGDELKILYDGFDNKYAYWIDDDSPNIHPIGWCYRTCHPMEEPSRELWVCGIKGCSGKGNVRYLKSPKHFSTKDCPYDFEKWEQRVAGLPLLPDRLTYTELPTVTKRSRSRKTVYSCDKKKDVPKKLKNSSILQKEKKIKIKPKKVTVKQIIKKNIKREQTKKKSPKKKSPKKKSPKKKTKREYTKNCIRKIMKMMDDIEYGSGRPVEKNLYRSTYGIKGRQWPDYPPLKMPPKSKQDARKWSVQEVGYFVDKVISLNSTYRTPDDEVKYANRFIKRGIDGMKFLTLTQDYFTKIMKIPLGSALKISNGIIKLRREIPQISYRDECFQYN